MAERTGTGRAIGGRTSFIAIRERGLVFDDRADLHIDVSGFESPDLKIVVDLYALDNPVHPEGHVGWWRFARPDAVGEVLISLQRTDAGLRVALDGGDSIDSWINPAVETKRIVVHAVLRSTATNALVADDCIPAFSTETELAAYRETFGRTWSSPRYAASPYVFDAGTTVHLVAPNIRLRDAVGNLVLDLYRLLRQNGVPTRLFSTSADLAISDLVEAEATLMSVVGPSDHILYFCSTGDPCLDELSRLPVPKAAYFHGITDPAKVRVFDPELAVNAARGIADIALLGRFGRVAANSHFSACQVAAASGVAPEGILVIPPKLAPLGTVAPPETARGTDILAVGQLNPHKKVEDVLRFFAAYRALEPAAKCHLVGPSHDPAYRDYLRWVETTELTLPPDAVVWHGSVPDGDLASLYASAGALLSMSEDEGFCLPLFEAMEAGLPVLAHGIPAVRETMNGTGLVFGRKQHDHLARALVAVLKDPDRRSALVEAQKARGAQLRAAMSGLAFFNLIQPDWRAVSD